MLRGSLWCCALAAVVALPAVARGADEPDGLTRARALYNTGQFDEAIATAESARLDLRQASAAAVVIARARLEQFRLGGEEADLSAARDELRRIDPTALEPRARVEWQVGVAETLFLEGQAGAAAELFGSLRDQTRELSPQDAERLLEWWAAAMERHAETRPIAEQQDTYRRVLDRMEAEIGRNPLSRVATYWLAAAARGVGDFDRAWNAAVAGWVRAGGLDEGAALRDDLERLVLQTIIPERARRHSGQPLDARDTIAEMASMAEEWESLTDRWMPVVSSEF